LASFKILSQNSQGETEEHRENIVIAGNAAEFLTINLPNTTTESYHYVDVL